MMMKICAIVMKISNIHEWVICEEKQPLGWILSIYPADDDSLMITKLVLSQGGKIQTFKKILCTLNVSSPGQ